MTHTHETEKVLLGGGRNTVTTKDGVVYRSASAWSPTTIAFLKHLEEYG